jgi:hypothetical protein
MFARFYRACNELLGYGARLMGCDNVLYSVSPDCGSARSWMIWAGGRVSGSCWAAGPGRVPWGCAEVAVTPVTLPGITQRRALGLYGAAPLTQSRVDGRKCDVQVDRVAMTAVSSWLLCLPVERMWQWEDDALGNGHASCTALIAGCNRLRKLTDTPIVKYVRGWRWLM